MREYEASKWICTNDVMDLDEDPYKNWERKYQNGHEAMHEVEEEQKALSSKDTMFKRLFKYIIGVNKDAEEIEMTRPVTTKRTELALNREKHEMCFWTGSQWEDRTLPDPIKDNVYIQEREAMKVFVK